MDLDNHPTTTDEIRSLVSDLGVLGKADFKLLLRWRMTIRKQTGLEKKKHRRGEDASSDEESSDDDDDDEDDEDDDEKEGADEKDQLLNEMSELKNSIDAQARRDKKKKAKLRAKERLRVARGLAASGEAIVEQEMDLFSLARIKTAKALDVVSKAPAPGSAAAYDSDEDPDEDADFGWVGFGYRGGRAAVR
jgi:AdoMet-dependent rRNA methyltransferase SPB1